MNISDKEKEYFSILLNIAKLQKQLISYSMDWEQRSPSQRCKVERLGFLGLKKHTPAAVYEKELLLIDLEALKRRARRIAPNSSGYYWWDIPWESVEKSLLFDLIENDQSDGWRFEHKWDKVQIESSDCLLFHEEGHCSSFSGESDLEYYETSRYSDAERSEMVKQYSKKVREEEFNDAVMLQGYRIRSLESGLVYDSINDYLFSAEHYLAKDYNKQAYEKSLSTQHQKNSVNVSSNSLHYHSTYFTAEYHVLPNGWLAAWNLHPYTLLNSAGDLPKALVERRQQKDATVSSAAFIADQDEIRGVPCSILGEYVAEPTEDMADAMRYAKIITCVADKLFIDE